MDVFNKQKIFLLYRHAIDELYCITYGETKRSKLETNINKLLYASSIDDVISSIDVLASMCAAKGTLYSTTFAYPYLDKPAAELTITTNSNGTFIFGNEKAFHDIPDTEYKFIRQNYSFLIAKNNIVINRLFIDNKSYIWLYEKTRPTNLFDDFDYISDDTKQKIVDSLKAMDVINTLYRDGNKNIVS